LDAPQFPDLPQPVHGGGRNQSGFGGATKKQGRQRRWPNHSISPTLTFPEVEFMIAAVIGQGSDIK
jgi:hypothetical protein